MCRQVPSLAPTTISPRGTRSVSAISLRMVLRRSSVSSAYLKNNLPEAVSETRPPERSRRRAPTSSSRARIWEEMAGWVRKRFSAAREKLERRATSRKISSWSKSMRCNVHRVVDRSDYNIRGRGGQGIMSRGEMSAESKTVSPWVRDQSRAVGENFDAGSADQFFVGGDQGEIENLGGSDQELISGIGVRKAQ